jgi:hypothetical protein
MNANHPPRGNRSRTIPEILNECDKVRAALRGRYNPTNPQVTRAQVKALEETFYALADAQAKARKAGASNYDQIVEETHRAYDAMDRAQRAYGGHGFHVLSRHNPAKTVSGLHIKYSPVNAAYFLMWHGTLLRIFETRKEAKAEMNYLLRTATTQQNPEGFQCPHCGKQFSAAQIESGEFRKHMAAHRASRNPSELLIMGANPQLTREQKDYWLAQKDYWENVEGAITRKAKKYAWEDVYKKWPELRGERSTNPMVEVVHGDNPPVEDITEEFTGTEVKWLDVYNEPHIPRGRYAYLAKLLSLHIKPAKGGQVQRITFGDGESAPLIVSDSSAKQIYFVGGNQDVSGALEAFGGFESNQAGWVELGQGRRIDYQGRKEHVADPDEDKWKHDHGEENGVLPTVLFDTRNKRLLYEGGDYRIDGPWIRN